MAGDKEHPVILYDYTPTRGRAGPENFLAGYHGYLQADAVASCQRVDVDPFAWFKDILVRIPNHAINRIAELLPHN